MDEQIKLLLFEKDKVISDLQGQISSLTSQLNQQNGLIESLNLQIGELNTNVNLLVGSNFCKNNVASTSNGGFTNRKTTKRTNDGNFFRRSKNVKINEYFPPVLDTNTGDIISDKNQNTNDEMDEDDSIIVSAGNSNLNVNNVVDNDTNNDTKTADGKDTWANVTSNSAKRESKPTPIQIGSFENDDFTKLLNTLRDKFAVDKFEWIHLRKTAKPRIICNNETDKRKIMEFLREIGCEFNTYAEKNAKQTAFIVRGLQYGNDNDNASAIRDTFAEFGVSTPSQISRFLTPSMKRQENPNILYQIVFRADENFGNLKQIRTIDGFRVKFEKMIGSKTL